MPLQPILKFLRPLALSLLCLAAAALGPDFSARLEAVETADALPRVFYSDPKVLVAVKARLATNDAALRPAFQRLLESANEALDDGIPTVTEKKKAPFSGDKHDYVSQAPYYWRDTNSPEGKYIRRDGQRNPESGGDSDAGRLSRVCFSAYNLAVAYYFTGDEKYAAKSAKFIRVFFLDPETRMNPNLNFGQGVPGESEGRPAGLISARCFVQLLDGVGLLAGSKAWTDADQHAMTAWAGQYFEWLTTSKIGRGEGAAKNNHGTFYDTQAVAFALFLGKTDAARRIISDAKTKRIALQIEPDGKEPLELARTLSYDYSVFNVRALMDLACLGRSVNVDLWHYQTKDGRGILKAVQFLARYADPKNKWPYEQIHRLNRRSLGELLVRAAPEYPNSGLADALKFFDSDEFADSPNRLLQ